MGRTRKKGFTLIELLVVVAIIALLLSIVVPSLNRAKIYAQRIMCGNNLRQQSLGIMLYAEQNDSRVPWTLAGVWLWDVSFWSTNQIKQYAGFKENDTFFCPGNRLATPEDARYWQYGLIDGTGPYPNPVPLRDETTIAENQQKYVRYRVLPYIYMLQKYDSSGNPSLESTLVTGEQAKWITKLSDVRNAGSTEMVADSIIAGTSDLGGLAFFEITAGGIDELSGGVLRDNSNHRSRHNFPTGHTYRGPKPEGGNIGFADGHVSWRMYGDAVNPDMRWRYTTDGMRFWW